MQIPTTTYLPYSDAVGDDHGPSVSGNPAHLRKRVGPLSRIVRLGGSRGAGQNCGEAPRARTGPAFVQGLACGLGWLALSYPPAVCRSSSLESSSLADGLRGLARPPARCSRPSHSIAKLLRGGQRAKDVCARLSAARYAVCLPICLALALQFLMLLLLIYGL